MIQTKLKEDIQQINPYIIEIEGELINTQQTKNIVFEGSQVSIYYIDGTVKHFIPKIAPDVQD